jgi:hypothetical protein
MTVRIPNSAISRHGFAYAKLLWRVHPDRGTANAFEGPLLKPGALVDSSALWPDGSYPTKPLLLENAGSDATGRGHNRSKQVYILWRYEPERSVWVEVVRTLTEGLEWVSSLVPVALREIGGAPAPDPDLARNVSRFFLSQLDKELGELPAGDRHLTLSLLYEQVAARLVRAA